MNNNIIGFLVIAGVIAVGFAIINRTIQREAAKIDQSIDELPANLVKAINPFR